MLKVHDLLLESTVCTTLRAFNRSGVTLKLLDGIQLLALELHPVSEALVVYQNSVLDRREFLDNRDDFTSLEVLAIEKLQDVIELRGCDVAVMVLVNLSDSSHYLLLLVVRVNGRNELLGSDWSLLDMRSVEVCHTKIAVHIHGLIDSLVVSYINFTVHFIEDNTVLLIINSCDVHSSLLVGTFHARETFEELIFLFFAQFIPMLFHNVHESLEDDLTLVILISCCLDIINEDGPVFTHLFEHFGEYINSNVLMHLLMEHAEVLVVLGRLPAFLVVAAVYLALLKLVLTEVKSFSWEHFTSDRELEVFV